MFYPREGYYLYKYVNRNTEKIEYVGITTDIVSRVRQHASLHGLDAKFAACVQECDIFFHACSSESEMRALESLLINHYKPALNESGKTDAPSSINPDNLVAWTLYQEPDFLEKKVTKLSRNTTKPKLIQFIPDETIQRSLDEIQRIHQTITAHPKLSKVLFSLSDDVYASEQLFPFDTDAIGWAEQHLPYATIYEDGRTIPCVLWPGILSITTEEGCENQLILMRLSSLRWFLANYNLIVSRYEKALCGEIRIKSDKFGRNPRYTY